VLAPLDDPVPVEPVVFVDPAAEETVPAPGALELLVAGVVKVTVELSAKVMVVDDEPSALVVLWVVAPESAEFSKPCKL
jgi:hypothetical protein